MSEALIVTAIALVSYPLFNWLLPYTLHVQRNELGLWNFWFERRDGR